MTGLSMSFKIILIGDSGVGKTSILYRYQGCDFQPEPTIGMAFYKKVVERKNIEITLEIWDTAGQEKFRKIAPLYYRNASAVLLCYDVSCRESLKGAQRWMDEIDVYLSQDCVKFLVGNKYDKGTSFEVDVEKEFKTKMYHIHTSAKTGLNIDSLFRRVARVLAKSKLKKIQNMDSKIITLQVQGPQEKENQRKCC